VALLVCRAVPGDRTAASVHGGSLCVAVIACFCALTGGPFPAGDCVRRRAMWRGGVKRHGGGCCWGGLTRSLCVCVPSAPCASMGGGAWVARLAGSARACARARAYT